MQSLTIEQVLAVRRKQCVAMCGNMETELKKRGSHELVMGRMKSHREFLEQSDFNLFNTDQSFKFVLNATVRGVSGFARHPIIRLHSIARILSFAKHTKSSRKVQLTEA